MATCRTGQILFLRKNHIDLDRPNPVITIADSVATNNGQSSVSFLRNRNNISGWVTTDSTDAANTEILVEFGDFLDVDYISLVRMNFKDFTIEWQDLSNVWTNISTVTNNTETTSVLELTSPVNAKAIRIIIQGTMIADDDKELRQLIITEKKYRFEGWAVVSRPVHSKNRKVSSMLSGKVNVVDKRGAFSCTLEIKLSGNENDLSMHEDIYEQREGLLLLISGGNETQFRTKRKGYRNEDIVLVKAVDEYSNPYDSGVYSMGMQIKMKLAETVF